METTTKKPTLDPQRTLLRKDFMATLLALTTNKEHETTLSTHIWKLKDEETNYEIHCTVKTFAN